MNKKIAFITLVCCLPINSMQTSKKRKTAAQALTVQTYNQKNRKLDGVFAVDPSVICASKMIGDCIGDVNFVADLITKNKMEGLCDTDSKTIDLPCINAEQWELIAPLLVLIQNNQHKKIPRRLPSSIHRLALVIKAAHFLNLPDVLEPAYKSAFAHINLEKYLYRPNYLNDAHQRYKRDEILVDIFNSSEKKPFIIEWLRHRFLRRMQSSQKLTSLFVLSNDRTKLLTVSCDDPTTAVIWDTQTGNRLRTLSGGHISNIKSAAWSPDDSIIITGSYIAAIWDINNKNPQAVIPPDVADARINAISWSPDGKRFILCYAEEVAQLYNAESKELIGFLSRVDPGAVTWSPDSSKFAIGFWNANIYDAIMGTYITTLDEHTDFISAITWSPDGTKIATGSYDKIAKIWDVSSLQCMATLRGHTSCITSIAWSHDSSTLVTTSYDATAKLWDAKTGKCTTTLKGHNAGVVTAALSPDGKKLVTGSNDLTARVWNVQTGKHLATLRGHKNYVQRVAWNANGTKIFTGAWDNRIITWKAELEHAAQQQLKYLSLEQGLFLTAVYDQYESDHKSKFQICTYCQPHLIATHKSLCTEIQKAINSYIECNPQCSYCEQEW